MALYLNRVFMKRICPIIKLFGLNTKILFNGFTVGVVMVFKIVSNQLIN